MQLFGRFGIFGTSGRLVMMKHDFVHGIKNLVRWFPIIWKDRDWDAHYINSMLKQKLVFMADYFDKSRLVVDNETMVKQIEFTIRVLDRITADDYIHPAYRKHLAARVYGGDPFHWINRQQTPEEREEWISWNHWEEHWRARDQKLLYAMLKKYAESWWD